MANRPLFTDLWLASESPRRIMLLNQAGLNPTVFKPRCIEDEPIHCTSPHRLVRDNACRKAESVIPAHSGVVILGADTVVALGHSILGKPHNVSHAREIISKLSGKTHRVFTGVAFANANGNILTRHAVSYVRFRPISKIELDWYIETNEWTDKAGAYGIQGYASTFVSAIHGCYSNIVGLPLSLVLHTLQSHFPGIWPAKRNQ